MINELIKNYVSTFSGQSNSYIADMMLLDKVTELSHRTLRGRIGEYKKSLLNKEECCTRYLTCDNNSCIPKQEFLESEGKSLYTENTWNKKETIDYFKNSWDTSSVNQLEPYLGGNPNNVLIIGDTQFPFHREGYLEHCLEAQRRFNCGITIHIGDVADNHYSSFHETNPDGFGAGEELDRVIAQTKEWHRLFPNTKVCVGNHDAIINRQAVKAGISSRWIKGLADVFETPTWEYDTEFIINGTMYTHTLGSNVLQAALLRQVNLVVGHEHSQAKIEYAASLDKLFWAMKVGAGVDDRKYAFNYAKTSTKKSIMSCGVVEGNIPFLIPMNL